jgi:ABC-type amino acid transport substrate-binding protein
MRRCLAPMMVLMVTLAPGNALPQSAVVSELEPQGTLRVGLLGYNPVLVTRRPDGSIDGVSVQTGKFVAEKLGTTFAPVIYETPQALVDSYGTKQWDILIGPRTPAAGKRSASPRIDARRQSLRRETWARVYRCK